MKANGRKFCKQDADYNDMVRYNSFCHDKLIEAGYSPQGWDAKTDTVCVMKFKNPNETWDTEGRKIYHFDSFTDAAENLIGITRKDFEKQRGGQNRPTHKKKDGSITKQTNISQEFITTCG
jgi:hypothetical protein